MRERDLTHGFKPLAEVVEVDAVEPAQEGDLEMERGYYEAATPSYPSTSEQESDSILPQLGMVVGAVVALGAVLFLVKKKLFSGSKMEESIQGVNASATSSARGDRGKSAITRPSK